MCTFQKHCRPFLRKQEQRVFRRNVLRLEASTNIRKRVTKKRKEKRIQRWSIPLDEFQSSVGEIRQMMVPILMAASAVDTVAKIACCQASTCKHHCCQVVFAKHTLCEAYSSAFSLEHFFFCFEYYVQMHTNHVRRDTHI
jgi:hypothetical protein